MTLSYGGDDVDLSALTTEQLIEIASNMSDAEDIQFSTTITPFMELEVSTDNKPLESVAATLNIAEVDGLHAFIPVTAEYGGLVETETGKAISLSEIPIGASLTSAFKEVVLSIHDIVKLFRLGPETQWKVTASTSSTCHRRNLAQEEFVIVSMGRPLALNLETSLGLFPSESF